ncbi:unnamed protein product [Fusarium graminearum]|uniref:Chromosome 1, complete genome n=1 Tax=Gibberella zeae (strain ATCC MYA-4620 / CBS 123657 / FGSC 9075 / NRRL 31084 / PH-1) TaxID=229533 RepID=I1S4H1_GIBZE|nr:hypothetical protein FGSG_11738 [Fusarium graminearum PH-1]ESU05429.1 hypothetical protein FGSG_11738 [Fusarium graminearum PH-1]CEF72165.1 unnamed protein product [Fusarium graminearum]CZS75427.1 unnamed protein product [Fusarium graminearum]|eukprot:XP_011315914.1 hypothetical protein FGSG_11738 [Fusarium graminearum PH-1]
MYRYLFCEAAGLSDSQKIAAVVSSLETFLWRLTGGKCQE